MSRNKIDALEFFVGGVPARVIYDMDVKNLSRLVSSSRRRKNEYTGRTLVEVCLIGLAAYFEAFCKNQFAAIVNICPQTLTNFTLKRDNTTVKLAHLIKISGEIEHRFGALLAEEYDFGSSRTINSLYFDLLGISPFSKDEERQYSEFLNDRNLLVHHGGIYTIKYHGQRSSKNPMPGLAHWDSLVIGRGDFLKWYAFLSDIVDKIATTSQKALKDFIKTEGIQLRRVNRKAVEYMGWKNED